MEYSLNEMKIEVTRKCPLACIHCSSDANEQQATEITVEMCMNIIQQAVDLGLKELSISGGEPLVWDGLIDIVRFANKKGLEVNVYTSGNIENVDTVFNKLSSSGLNKAVFSLYSDVMQEHERITRKRNSFNNTILAIKTANKYSIKTEVHFVALKKSFRCLEGIVRLASSIGVQCVSILRFVPQGRGSLLDVMSKEENAELVSIIKKLRQEQFIIRTGSPYNVLLLNEEPKCMAARDRLIIDPYLKIYPCDAFKQISSIDIVQTEILSSVEDNSLSECWENSPYFNAVRNALETSQKIGHCKGCPLYIKCLSGCLAQKFIINQSLAPDRDPACTRS